MTETFDSAAKQLVDTKIARPAQDEYAKCLFERFGLGLAPTLDEVEPIAIELLANPGSAPTAVELVLGREVRSEELLWGGMAWLGDQLSRTDANMQATDKYDTLLILVADTNQEEPR